MDDQTTGPADARTTRPAPDKPRRQRLHVRRRVVIICATSLAVLHRRHHRPVGHVQPAERQHQDRRHPRRRRAGAADAPKPESSTPASGTHASMNVLLIGSDDRDGTNAQYGDANSGARSDTRCCCTCRGPEERDGRLDPARLDGADARVPPVRRNPVAAPVRDVQRGVLDRRRGVHGETVEAFSGLTVDHVLVVDFTGFKKLIDAMGGVPVHLDQAVDDPDSHLDLPAGTTVVNGEQALAFVRARHNLGDGSDIGRMGRQQEFLNSALDTLAGNGPSTTPRSSTRSWTPPPRPDDDPALGSLPALADFASDLKQVPRQQITYLTVRGSGTSRTRTGCSWREGAGAFHGDAAGRAGAADVLALSAKQGEQTTP